MKAIQFARFGGSDVLAYVDVPRPVPQGDDLLIEVTAAGVSCVDIRERAGIYQRANAHVGGVVLPRVPGLQVVGVVVEVGQRGDTSLIGAKVVAILPDGGGYAQFVTAPSMMTIPLPPSVDEAMMAAIPMPGVTAYLMLTASTQVAPGESVLVHGAGGGVGSLAVQIAKSLGAGVVIATAGTEEKRELARRLGADEAVDYDAPGWTKRVLQKTGGRGVDILLESIGGDIFEQNFACLATFGRYIIFGSTRGPAPPIEPRRLMSKCQTLTGFYMPVFYAKPKCVHEALSFLVAHAKDGTLRAHVSSTLPLRRAADAHRLLEERRVIGAILLDPRV